VTLGSFCENCRSTYVAPIINYHKKDWATFLGYFFTNAPGHPGCKVGNVSKKLTPFVERKSMHDDSSNLISAAKPEFYLIVHKTTNTFGTYLCMYTHTYIIRMVITKLNAIMRVLKATTILGNFLNNDFLILCYIMTNTVLFRHVLNHT
jgi:hypothetical protein